MNLIITGACGHIGSYVAENIHKVKKIKNTILIDNLKSNRFCSIFNINKKNNLKLSEVKNLKRNESDLFKQETLDSIFKLSNESSLGFRDLNNNYGLVFINRINPSDNLIHGNDKQKLILNVQASFNQSMENIIKKKLSDDIEYELYIKNINNLFL